MMALDVVHPARTTAKDNETNALDFMPHPFCSGLEIDLKARHDVPAKDVSKRYTTKGEQATCLGAGQSDAPCASVDLSVLRCSRTAIASKTRSTCHQSSMTCPDAAAD